MSDKLINIDNGGTLTDICVTDGGKVYRTKTVTTPHDLSKCLFDGLRKVSGLIYGAEDLTALLLTTRYIRYSTTQGTNALVERKGPRLGLIHAGDACDPAALQGDENSRALFAALVGARSQQLDLDGTPAQQAQAAVRSVNTLASQGANRIVVALAVPARESREAELKRALLRAFPPHMLGALPILYSHELSEDPDHARRTWTCLFNAFLHPSMERFLYAADHRLRAGKARNPLLIFRNDGYSARVAKTIAIKTYSSGPRGGMEGAKALAAQYGFGRLLTMDIGGTTIDMGLVENSQIGELRHGVIEGVATSFPLCNVVSAGVGGSSIIRVAEGRIVVGPDSVGSAPGPACFGLGGRQATITDAFLLQGLLDPNSYFGGDLAIDPDRARAAIREQVAAPLGMSDGDAAEAMEKAWVEAVVENLRQYTRIGPEVTLAAFGGAGPFVVCRIAAAAGIDEVVIPGLAAVFSAYGIGFSDIGHEFTALVASADPAELQSARDTLRDRAARAMRAEGADLADCRLHETLSVETSGQQRLIPLGETLPDGIPAGARLSLVLKAVRPLQHATLDGKFGGSGHPAQPVGVRSLRMAGREVDAPLYRVEDQAAGAVAAGPAVLEEAFFTCRVDAGWRFEINNAGDIRLSRTVPQEGQP